MPTNLEKVVLPDSVSAQNVRLANEFSMTNLPVDLDVFGAKEIRDVLKIRAHCLRAGFPAKHIIIATLNDIRDHYILKVGLPTYLSQMLGDLAKTSIKNCTFYDETDQPIKFELVHQPDQPVQRFIAKHFRWDMLPFRVEVSKDTDPNRIEVRYL